MTPSLSMAYRTFTKETFVLMWKQQMLKMLTLQYTAFILATSLTAVSCQSVTIASNVSEGETVCPGQTVTFTCVTRGALFVQWVSEDYIGNGDIQVSETIPFNQRVQRSGNRNVFATLVNRTVEDRILVLVSQLHVIVSSVPLTPSVTCINDFDTTRKTSTFRVQGEPDVPQVTTAEYVMGTCGLNISLTPPENFTTGDTIQVDIDGNIHTVTSSDSVTSQTVSYAVSSCDFLNVSARIVDRCGRQGLSSSTVTVNPDGVCNSSACMDDDTPGPPGPPGPPSDSALSTGVVVAIVVVVAVIVIAVVVFLAVVIGFCCYFNSTKNTPKRVSDMNLESKNDEEDTKFREA